MITRLSYQMVQCQDVSYCDFCNQPIPANEYHFIHYVAPVPTAHPADEYDVACVLCAGPKGWIDRYVEE